MFKQHDRVILRELAARVAETAALPVMTERKALWHRHHRLHPVRPMILVFPEGAWGELLPEGAMQCEEQPARGIEWDLRSRLYAFEHFQSDNVVEAEWVVNKVIHQTGWGLTAKHHDSTEARGAWAFDPIITEPADLKKLTFPEVTYDEEATQRTLAEMQELFGDILTVRLKGVRHISFHLMSQYTGLRGLEETMMDMYEEPEMLHEAMAILEKGNRRIVQQYEQLNLLDVNNDNTYHSSGGIGYTDELPRTDGDPAQVRPCDMWASAESQELTLVSPEMHEEFAMQYERRLLEPFGLNGYGCCDDLTNKLEHVLAIPNMRRISIAPVAHVDTCAERLGNRAIFSWKPQPSHLVGEFDHGFVRAYIRHTLAVAQANGCVLEMILKDTHTCQQHPERFDWWTRIARELVDEIPCHA